MSAQFNSNTFLQTATVLLVTAHAAGLLGVWFGPRGVNFLLGLNAAVAVAVLVYAASRARYILVVMDWPYLGLIAFEVLVLGGAVWALRSSRVALIGSYVAFGLHALVSIAAVVFAFVFKLNKLM